MSSALGMVRVATLGDGRRYLVQQLCFRTGRVHCWGEVLSVGARDGRVQHGPSLTFRLAECRLAEAARTTRLISELYEQGKEARTSRARVRAAARQAESGSPDEMGRLRMERAMRGGSR